MSPRPVLANFQCTVHGIKHLQHGVTTTAVHVQNGSSNTGAPRNTMQPHTLPAAPDNFWVAHRLRWPRLYTWWLQGGLRGRGILRTTPTREKGSRYPWSKPDRGFHQTAATPAAARAWEKQSSPHPSPRPRNGVPGRPSASPRASPCHVAPPRPSAGGRPRGSTMLREHVCPRRAPGPKDPLPDALTALLPGGRAAGGRGSRARARGAAAARPARITDAPKTWPAPVPAPERSARAGREVIPPARGSPASLRSHWPPGRRRSQ